MSAGVELGRPQGRANANTKRKQNLLALLGALQELQEDEESDVSPQELERELARPATFSDERLGAEAFDKLDSTIKSLDRELRRLANVSRDLASSVGIVKSSLNLRATLTGVRRLLRVNAADLFPHKVRRTPSLSLNEELGLPEGTDSGGTQKEDLEDLPKQFHLLVQDVDFFLQCLNDFSEFKDEALNDAILVFKKEVKYLSTYMKEYKGRFKDNAIKKYVHDVTEQHLGEPIDDVAISLTTFIDTGIRAIRSAQNQAATNFLTLSTVGTFFSAVTATTLQFSFNEANTTLQVTVNSFWFCSLVFSIASVVNSLLAYMWEHALYRSPGHYAPWWVTNWIKRSPLIFLIISAAAFSIGLCAFAYSSNQNIITSTLTTVFTSISSVGLISVTLWFGCEKWTFTHHRGEKWLMQIIDELVNRSPLLLWVSKRLSSHIAQALTSHKEPHAPSQTPAYVADEKPLRGISQQVKPQDGEVVNGVKPKPDIPDATIIDIHPASLDDVAERLKVPAQGRQQTLRTAAATRNVGLQDVGTVMSAVQQLVHLNRQAVSKRMNRVGRSLLMLKSMTPTATLTSHDTLVRHIQFSPDGQHLATCSWDKRAMIFDLKDTSSPQIIDHPSELLSQLAWSPAGDMLICKTLRGMTIWTSEGELERKIDRGRAVESVSWFPHGEAFVSVEGAEIRKLDLEGNVLDQFTVPDAVIHDVVITKDSTRIICVATSSPRTSTDDSEVDIVYRKEEVIMVYNLLNKKIESQVPVLGESRNVKLSKDGTTVLVSYENRTPPQRWKIGLRKNKSDDVNVIQETETAFLSLEQTYMPRRPVDFTGPCHFGGMFDELVICVGKNGIIYVWDSRTGILLHHYSTQDVDGELTCLAWNHESKEFMFGTGSNDGTVRIWAPKVSTSTGSRGHVVAGSVSPRTASPLQSIQEKARLAGGLAIDHVHPKGSAMTIKEEFESDDEDEDDDEPVIRIVEFLRALGHSDL